MWWQAILNFELHIPRTASSPLHPTSPRHSLSQREGAWSVSFLPTPQDFEVEGKHGLGWWQLLLLFSPCLCLSLFFFFFPSLPHLFPPTFPACLSSLLFSSFHLSFSLFFLFSSFLPLLHFPFLSFILFLFFLFFPFLAFLHSILSSNYFFFVNV